MIKVHQCILLLRLQALTLRHFSAIKPALKLVENIMVMVLKFTDIVKTLGKDDCCKLFFKDL